MPETDRSRRNAIVSWSNYFKYLLRYTFRKEHLQLLKENIFSYINHSTVKFKNLFSKLPYPIIKFLWCNSPQPNLTLQLIRTYSVFFKSRLFGQMFRPMVEGLIIPPRVKYSSTTSTVCSTSFIFTFSHSTIQYCADYWFRDYTAKFFVGPWVRKSNFLQIGIFVGTHHNSKTKQKKIADNLIWYFT